MNSFFGLGLIFCDRYDGVRDFVKVGEGLVIWVVGDNERDFAGEFAALMAVEEIDEAVIVFRDQDDHARAV